MLTASKGTKMIAPKAIETPLKTGLSCKSFKMKLTAKIKNKILKLGITKLQNSFLLDLPLKSEKWVNTFQ
jgi:hypothetical protein